MTIWRMFGAALIVLSSGTAKVSAQGAPGAGQQVAPGAGQNEVTRLMLVVESRVVRFTTSGEPMDWHLAIVNQLGQLVFDSGAVYGSAIEWPVVDESGQVIASALRLLADP